MKIKLSKEKWKEVGKQAGWMKQAGPYDATMGYSGKDLASDIDAAKSRRRTVKVTMSDGDTITTGINGTKQEIIDYYTKHDFVKQDEKTMHHGVNVEFLA